MGADGVKVNAMTTTKKKPAPPQKSPPDWLKEVQDLVAAHVPADVSLSQELIRTRRKAAKAGG